MMTRARLYNIFCSILLCLPLIKGQAQPGIQSYLQGLKVLSANELAYDYCVQLLTEKGVITDSIYGSLYKSGNRYLDSCSMALNISDGSYYCKLNFDRKTALFCDIKKLEQTLDTDFSKDHSYIGTIPDSVIARYGSLTIDTSHKNKYVLNIRLTGQRLSLIILHLQRKDLQPERVIFEYTERTGSGGQEPVYRQRYSLFHIRNTVPPSVFDISRILTIQQDKVQLKRKYTDYKLTQII